MRFPAALGFSGYPEFQKALEDILQEKIHSFDRIDVLNSHMTTNMVVNNVMSMDARKMPLHVPLMYGAYIAVALSPMG